MLLEISTHKRKNGVAGCVDATVHFFVSVLVVTERLGEILRGNYRPLFWKKFRDEVKEGVNSINTAA